LEIALKEATEFHDALQAFVDWLTGAEKTLTSAKPVSRVMETLLGQFLPLLKSLQYAAKF
jgi:dystonin